MAITQWSNSTTLTHFSFTLAEGETRRPTKPAIFCYDCLGDDGLSLPGVRLVMKRDVVAVAVAVRNAVYGKLILRAVVLLHSAHLQAGEAAP